MKRLPILIFTVAFALIGSVIALKSAEAVPAFARQVGVPCFGCHTQHIPLLNAFGREFKLGGMTQTAQELIEDDGISLPPVANIGFIMKYRYRKTDPKTEPTVKTGTDRGTWDLPDEAALWLGGRVAENWGFATEFPGPAAVLKLVYSKDFGGVQGGLVIYNNDGHGPGSSMELWNSHGVKNHRQFERRWTYTSSVLGGVGMGNASGVHIFAGADLWFANVGIWVPTPTGGDAGTDFANYFRLAITPAVAEGLDLMIGVQASAGSAKAAETLGQPAGVGPIKEFKMGSTRIDFQAMTDVGGMSLLVVGEYQVNPHDTKSFYNTGTKDETGLSVSASLGITPMAGLQAAYATYSDIDGAASNADMNATQFGGYYNFAQNIMLDLEYTTFGGDARTLDNELMLMLQVGI
ncbi:MAG: hypothetical protein ACE5EN_01490 [Nitrospinota bacterium]